MMAALAEPSPPPSWIADALLPKAPLALRGTLALQAAVPDLMVVVPAYEWLALMLSPALAGSQSMVTLPDPEITPLNMVAYPSAATRVVSLLRVIGPQVMRPLPVL